jgi:hypothetical protein
MVEGPFMPPSLQLSMDPSSLVGLWYLAGSQADERAVSVHRFVIRFDLIAGELRGAVVDPSRDVWLEDLSFDGTRLSFKLLQSSDAGREPITILPYPLLLHAVADGRFEGSWMKSETESVAIPLKLWRAHPPGHPPDAGLR